MRTASVAAVFFVALGTGSAAAQLEDQPEGHHSALTAVDGGLVEDSTLAAWFERLLVAPDGKLRAADAAFLFQSSFGGGMLDDLRDVLDPSGLPWVGGAASKHDDPPTGFVTPEENTTVEIRPYDARWVSVAPLDAWTRELARPDATAPGGLSGDLLIDRSLIAAIDAAGQNSAAREFDAGQSTASNGGGAIRLVDKLKRGHHAILWAGVTDRLRVFNDIAAVRAALSRLWANETHSIVVLFGDGSHKVSYDPGQNDLPAEWHAVAATVTNLKAALEGLAPALDVDDQVVFYATGHGTPIVEGCSQTPCPLGAVSTLPKGNELVLPLHLSAGELASFLQRNIVAPSLRFGYTGEVRRNAIIAAVNDRSLGILRHEGSPTILQVPRDLLGGANTVRIHSHNATSIDLQVRLVASASIGTDPVRDCNANHVDDAVDLATRRSADLNGNRVPDDCERRSYKPSNLANRPTHPGRPARPVKPLRPERPPRPPRG
jgi:hypothetical protein